jgi:hypothetical protein
MHRAMKEQSTGNSATSRGLVVIARDTSGQVITRLVCTRSRTVMSAMKSARSVLILKEGAVRVEVHFQETPTSVYPGKPLAVISTDDLILTHHQIS